MLRVVMVIVHVDHDMIVGRILVVPDWLMLNLIVIIHRDMVVVYDGAEDNNAAVVSRMSVCML